MTTENDTGGADLAAERERIEAMMGSPRVADARDRQQGQKTYIRPRNASTLILVDTSGSSPKILMGRRNKKLKFMPGALVFPGGSVDRNDGSVVAANELSQKTENRLLNAMRGRPTKRGARALGMAAVREVAEECGLLIGQKGSFSTPHADWQDFQSQQVVPDLSGLRLFGRAITPPGLTRRFDTWFFLADASQVAHTPASGFAPDGELEELQWIAPDKAIAEDTRAITRVMLVELIDRLKKDADLSEDFPASYYHMVRGKFSKQVI